MSKPFQIAVLSDIHYAGAAERARVGFQLEGVGPAWQRWAVQTYRHYVWLRDPFAHNGLLDRFLVEAAHADHVVANGDYSCDSAFIGVSDQAAFLSAHECLEKLRQSFVGRFEASFGDHEIGKQMMGGERGGLRLASFHRARTELGLRPLWKLTVGDYLLIGITSTLVAWPVYEAESLVSEQPEWKTLRAAHLEDICQTFAAVQPRQRVLLFCHDPTALPFLWKEPAIRAKLDQVERTIIGHLHSELILWQSRILAGMPVVRFLGHTTRRLSTALNEARHWRPFKVLLCPALAGIELSRGGGYYTLEIDMEGRRPARFQRHRLAR